MVGRDLEEIDPLAMEEELGPKGLAEAEPDAERRGLGPGDVHPPHPPHPPPHPPPPQPPPHPPAPPLAPTLNRVFT